MATYGKVPEIDPLSSRHWRRVRVKISKGLGGWVYYKNLGWPDQDAHARRVRED